jgi:hypothetical protein
MPRDTKQWELAIYLFSLWKHFPEQRLGQFIVNLTGRDDPFHVTDEDMMDAIEAVYANNHPILVIP